MRSGLVTAVLVAAAIGAAGCDGGGGEVVGGQAAPVSGSAATTTVPAPSTSSATPSATPVATPSATPVVTSSAAAPPPLAGEQHAFVRAVDPGRRTVTIDVVDWYTGQAAVKACAEDGKTSAGAPFCKVYYYRNRNPLQRTIPVAADAAITVVRYGTAGVDTDSPATLADLSSRLDLFQLRVDGGVVTSLAQVYLP
jgi:hypothetical protein